MPITIERNLIICSVQGEKVKVPAKNNFTIRVKPNETNTLEEELTDLSKVQKIVKHAELHGSTILFDIVNQLKTNCTTDHPDAFWFREKYFVSLPFQKEGSFKAQKASTNHMSPTEQELCKAEIKDLLDKKLIEPCKSPRHIRPSMSTSIQNRSVEKGD